MRGHLAAGAPQRAFRAAEVGWTAARAGLPGGHPLALDASRALAVTALESGQPEVAAEASRRLLGLLEEDDPRRAFALADLGHAKMAVGDPRAAEAHLEAALDTLEDLVDEPGLAVVPLLAGLGALAAARDDGLDAAKLYAARALDILIEVRGEAAPAVADALVFCALLDLKAGAPRGAAALLDRAARIYAAAEVDAPRRAVALRLLAEARGLSGDRSRAAAARAAAPGVDPELDAALQNMAKTLRAAARRLAPGPT